MYKASMFYVEVINTVVFRSNCIFPDFKDFSSKASIKNISNHSGGNFSV